MPTEPGSPEARRLKLFSLADHLGMSRDERLEIAKLVLHRDVTTWKNLEIGQVNRLLDALEGAVAMDEIRRQRVRIPAARA